MVVESEARARYVVHYSGIDIASVENSLGYGACIERKAGPFVEIVSELAASAIRS